MSRRRILALEPYYGGSHQAFIDTWMRYSRHEWRLQTMPARHWKWRMRGSALCFAERLADAPAGRFDVIFASEMTAIGDLKALLPRDWRDVPIVCYFHENQLSYPLSPHDWRDYQYGFTNITSALAAEAVWFNSGAHRREFLDAAAGLLAKMSDFKLPAAVESIERKSVVQYPAVEPPPADIDREKRRSGPLRLLWCHRWEYDKDPESFVETLEALDDGNSEFELVLVGEQFRTKPAAFERLQRRLAGRIVHAGYLESREDYWRMIATCDVVISTARQENFGIAVVEAMLAGCMPLLPRRLSYPEILPAAWHADYLYDSDAELLERLQGLCAERVQMHSDRNDEPTSLAAEIRSRYGAETQVPRLDDALAEILDA